LYASTLRTLNLADNSINEEGAFELAEALGVPREPDEDVKLDGEYNACLGCIDVRGNNFCGEGARKLSEALGRRKAQWESMNCIPLQQLRLDAISALDLSGKCIGVEGLMVLALWMAHNQSVITLGLTNNQIGRKGRDSVEERDEGMEALASALTTNHRLTSLDLSDNSLAHNSVSALAVGLAQNQSLRHLSLAHNLLRPDGARAVAAMFKPQEAWRCNIGLTSLDLSYNQLTARGMNMAGVEVLAEGLSAAGSRWRMGLARLHHSAIVRPAHQLRHTAGWLAGMNMAHHEIGSSKVFALKILNLEGNMLDPAIKHTLQSVLLRSMSVTM
ncbi:hypothetical protein CYMTET_35898, partial [Cymbomonas tetramitiformis]